MQILNKVLMKKMPHRYLRGGSVMDPQTKNVLCTRNEIVLWHRAACCLLYIYRFFFFLFFLFIVICLRLPSALQSRLICCPVKTGSYISVWECHSALCSLATKNRLSLENTSTIALESSVLRVSSLKVLQYLKRSIMHAIHDEWSLITSPRWKNVG